MSCFDFLIFVEPSQAKNEFESEITCEKREETTILKGNFTASDVGPSWMISHETDEEKKEKDISSDEKPEKQIKYLVKK